jgi:hypothetical protein
MFVMVVALIIPALSRVERIAGLASAVWAATISILSRYLDLQIFMTIGRQNARLQNFCTSLMLLKFQ